MPIRNGIVDRLEFIPQNGHMLDELLSREDAEALLAPHLDPLRGFVNEGWSDWLDAVKASPFLATARTTSRANIVYDRISQRAEEYFDGLGIPTSRKRKFLTVSLDDGRLIMRFKKFESKSLRTSGIPTQQRMEFELQQVVLDGTASTHVVVGYLPDELGLDLDVVAIACSYNRNVIWQIDLNNDGLGAVVPVRTNSPQGPSVRSTRPAAREDSQEG